MAQDKSIVVFGAGPALGLSTARRFAREGHAVTLVGRNATTVDPLVAALRADGVTADRLLADLADPAAARAAAEQVGTPDVVVYAPGGTERLPVAVSALDAATLATWLPLNLLSPVDIAHVIVPGMVARGSGAFLVAQGVAVREPMPELGSVSVGQGALLTYLRALARDVEASGVRVASLQIGRLIRGSAAEALVEQGYYDEVQSGPMPRVDPDELAERLWELAQPAAPVELVA
ncbi:SDR family NAD(P)-dependent oxidoreductase [Pseudonocardia sp. CA-107938]|uniref:SDR family NAD(P)-dependent oxidoreductase n=1 Tax=Pseudonocardia sp. CA-107938 TaxID=3240021 RepID=UPI003D9407C3